MLMATLAVRGELLVLLKKSRNMVVDHMTHTQDILRKVDLISEPILAAQEETMVLLGKATLEAQEETMVLLG